MRVTNIKLVCLLAGFLAIPFTVGVVSAKASAEKPQIAQSRQPERPQTPAPQPVKYSYVAQPGDSYTLLARKAVQTYGKKTNLKLSLGGIIFAETNLTQAAGSPQLEVGQKIEITETTIKDWAEKANTLSAETQAAWSQFVQAVDFNTDHVGQQ